MSSSVDGLVSGLDTTTLISKLMQAEAVPQNQLRTRVGTQTTKVSAYQTVNTKMSAVQAAADALAKPDAWTSTNVTSSTTSVSASTTGGALPGTVTFDVTQLASAYSSYSQEKLPLTGSTITNGTPISITKNGVPVPLTTQPADGSLQSVVAAINASSDKTGVRANAIAVNGTDYQLQLTSTTTGAASQFQVTGLTLTPLQLAPAQDAKILLGGTGFDALYATSATNTFTGIAAGLTFTASKVESGVSLSVSKDNGSVADKMQAMVDAMNAGKAQIDMASSWDATSKKGGPLSGNSTVRQINMALTGTVTGLTDPTKTLSQIGVQVDRSGKVIFDRQKFLDAYTAKPGDTQALAADFATRVSAVAKGASDSTTGTLTTAIAGTNTLIKTLNASIADWDDRLQVRQATLKKTYSALEVALGKMKDQANWLAGQIASLPSNSSKN